MASSPDEHDATPSCVVASIKRSATHDGPGVRTTVFLKGCPLRCRWCQNPEALEPAPQLMFSEKLCEQCRACADVCAQHAHRFDEGAHRIAFDRCVSCGQCVDRCAAEALEIVGQEQTVAQVMETALRDRRYYETSGGGVTLSGGEPLAQPGFALALARACRDAGLHVALDTCGHARPDAFDPLVDAVDLFLFDLKAADDARHRLLTGVGNAAILRNLRHAAASGSRVWIRIPIVPGLNDSDDELARMAELVAGLPVPAPVQCLAYHEYATHKYEALGMSGRTHEACEPSAERLRRAHEIFTQRNVGLIEEQRV